MSGGETITDAGTTIWVSSEIKEWLTSLRVDPRQSYDSVLRNLKVALRRAKRNGA